MGYKAKNKRSKPYNMSLIIKYNMARKCVRAHIPQSQALLKSAAQNDRQMSCISNGQSNRKS